MGRGQGDTARLAEGSGFVDHPLAEQFVKRLVDVDQAEVTKRLGHEAGVDEVHLSVFNATAVKVDVHPMVGHRLGKGFLVVQGVGVAQEIPRRIDERVHRIRFSFSWSTATWTVHVQEGFGGGQRVALTEDHVARQFDRKVLLGNGDGSAFPAMNHRNRGPPVPLPRNEPRSNLPVDGLGPSSRLLQGVAHGLLCFRPVEAVKTFERTVDHPSKVDLSLLHGGVAVSAFLHHQHALDGDVVLLGEIVVSLVVGGHGHHGTCPVGGDDEIADPNGNMLTGQRMNSVASGKHTFLLVHVLDAVKLRHRGHFVVEGFPSCFVLGSCDQGFSQGVFWSEGDKGGPEQRIRTGGEDFDVTLVVHNTETNVRALRTTQPVSLERFDVFGEADGVEPILELLAVGWEVKEPLVHLLLGDRPVAAPASTGFHLLVRKHRAARRTPVDGRELARRQTVLHELGEEPLVPLVVPRVMALERASPVVGEAHPLDLFRDGRHVPFGDVVWMATLGNRSVFCRHPEGIEAHGVKHIKAHQPLEAGHGVADGIISNVPHVHFSRRVRVHLKAVEFGTVAVNVSVKQACFVPSLLPPNFVHGFCLG